MSNRIFAVRRFVCSLLFLGILGGALFGCTKGATSNDPERRLRDYISKSFTVSKLEDREALMEFLTGEAKVRLAAWSGEQFREAFIDSRRQFVKLTFTEVKPQSPTEVSITYELTYFDQGKGHDAKVTNKKLCQMVQKDGKWLIGNVTNMKELIEYKNEMSLP